MEKQKIRVLFIEFGMSFGGALNSLEDTLKAMDDVEPTVVTFIKTNIGEVIGSDKAFRLFSFFNYKLKQQFKEFCQSKRIPKLLEKIGFKCIALGELLNNLVNLLIIYVIARRKNIEIVHCNNNIVKLAYDVAKLTKRPLIYHFRGPDSFKNLPEKVRLGADAYLSVSQHLAEHFSTDVGVDKQQFFIIPDPVNTQDFAESVFDVNRKKALYHCDENDFVILIPARIVPFKGQLEFIQALNPLFKKGLKIKIALLGDSADFGKAYLEKIQAFIKDNKLETHVTLLGYKQNVIDYYTAADAIVGSSLGQEGFGRTIIEGFAAKKVVVSTCFGGPSEIIEHEKSGILYHPEHDSVADIFQSLYESVELREKLADAGFAQLPKYQPKTVAEQISSVYLDVLNKKKT